MSYKLEICKNVEEWCGFISESEQYNIFASKLYLNFRFNEFDAYLLFKDDIFLIGCLIKKNYKKGPSEMYQNFFYSKYLDSINLSKSIKIKLEATETILDKLYKKYNQIFISLHHSITDIRSFQWLNYNNKDKKKFNIAIRYTGLLNLSSYNDFKSYFLKIRPSRRQDYNKSLKNKFTSIEKFDSNIICSLLKKTFERQKITETSDEIANKKNVIQDAINNKYGRLLVSYTPNNKPVSASCFLFDNKCAYYYAGASDPNYRNFGIGTQVILDQLEFFFNNKIKQFDFMGINSPNRGDFKTSFNANPVIYFDMKILK